MQHLWSICHKQSGWQMRICEQASKRIFKPFVKQNFPALMDGAGPVDGVDQPRAGSGPGPLSMNLHGLLLTVI